jgi:outer membrane murein-binding lipoprotein Lpp
MKNLNKYLTAIAFMTVLLFSGCSTPSQKVENAETDVVKAEAALEAAYKDDMANYRAETTVRIAANEKSMAEFKERIATEKEEARSEYLAKIEVLERGNTNMKKRIDDYKSDGKENWKQFKEAFNNEMDDLGNALQDLTTSKD